MPTVSEDDRRRTLNRQHIINATGLRTSQYRGVVSSPNIVIAFADDWGRYASAYRGLAGSDPWNELIETPNFDRLAAEGALFTNAFVPAPTCTPCRSSILAGRYF